MKKSIGRILTLVLSLALILSMLSFSAFAEVGVDTNPVTKGDVQYKGTVKIGSVMCETGAVAGVGIPYSQFYKLFVKYINEVWGGVAKGADDVGYYLDHTSYDDGTDGVQGFTYMQKLIDDDQVFSLVGNLGTWNIASSQNYIVESGVPSVYWGTGSALQYALPAEGNQRFTFPVQPIYITEGRIMLLRAMNMPAIADSGVESVKKIGVIYSADDSGQQIYSGVELQLAQVQGDKPEVVYVMVNTKVADEMTSQVAQLEGCDVVIIGGLQAYFNPIYTAMQSNPTTRGIPTIVSYVNVALTNIPVDVAKEADTSDIYGGAWVVIDPAAQTEQQKAEIAEFQAVLTWGAEKGYITAADRDAYMGSAYSMSSYIALKVFMTGMDRLADKEITRDAYLAAMESERIHVPISGGVDYSNAQRIGLDGMAFAKFNKAYTTAFDAFFTIDGMKSINELLGQ